MARRRSGSKTANACLTDQPDLSVYDQLFEDEEEEGKENEGDDRPW